MSAYDLDVLVIGGGGSAGFTAATSAMKSGGRVGLVEAGRLGGLCILAGCMPSKTLLHSAAEVWQKGVAGMAAYPEIHRYTRGLVELLAGGRERAVAAREQRGLKVYRGHASFVDPHTVEIEGNRISAASLVIATGSRELVPEVPGLASSGYLTSHSFMSLEELPESLIVLGGGTMAVELAQFALRMGMAVTIIQRSEHLVSGEDLRLGHILADALATEGGAVYTGTSLSQVSREDGQVVVHFGHHGHEHTVRAQTLLLALGRRPNTSGLNLAAAGVELGPGGQVLVDGFMRTSASHIYGAGDVTGGPMVVNRAIEQGKVAGLNAGGGEPVEMDGRVLPRAVFTDPQFARVGLNHTEAVAKGIAFAEADWDLGGMGVAKTYPQPIAGYMTLRAERSSGRIIGAELVAPEASLMIHDVAVCMALGGTAADLAAIPYIHPCLSEITNFTAGKLAKMLKD